VLRWFIARLLLPLASLGLLAFDARAETVPHSLTFRYSPYEQQAIAIAAKQLDGQIDDEPEGKRIESIELLRLDPIEPRDPLPSWLNAVHARTRESVIRRELVTRAGDRYRKVLVEESARKLRALPPITLVVCVAFRGTSDDRVRLVVITKDVWSLFFDVSWSGGSGGFSSFMVAPEESNLLGLHHKLAAEFNWNPYAYALGAHYEIPRIDGSAVNLVTDANLIIGDRQASSAEGSFGKVQAILPLRTDRQRYAWFTSFDWRDEVSRTFDGATLGTFKRAGSDDAAPPIDRAWRTVHDRATGALTRSFGWKYKQDLTVFVSAERASYRLPEAVRTTNSLADIVAFETSLLPTSYSTVGPGLEWHAYTSDFLRTYELETLGLQEDFRLGHSVVFDVSPAYHSEAHGYDALPEQAKYEALQLGVHAAVQETQPLRDGFVRATVQAAASLSALSRTTGPQAGNPLVGSTFGGSTIRNGVLEGRLRVASPRLGFGRLISDALVTMRLHDALDLSQQYGNSSRLRGYAPGFVAGKDTVVANLEFRSSAVQLATEQVGAVVFYDVAAANPNSGDDPTLANLASRSSIGVGIRVVTPLLERAGMRLDFAVPLDRSVGQFPGDSAEKPGPFAFWFTFGQAFDVGDVTLTTPP
jgi:hypothetical protein